MKRDLPLHGVDNRILRTFIYVDPVHKEVAID